MTVWVIAALVAASILAALVMACLLIMAAPDTEERDQMDHAGWW
jgi:hypothetical protein